MDLLVKFFSVLFERGIYPDSWTESIIIPLFKKGNQNDPDNYRGISYAISVVNYIVPLLTTGYSSGLNRTI